MDAGELHRLARLLRVIALEATADAGEAPVSAGDLAIAKDLADHPGSSVGEVAERTLLAQSLISRTVAKMETAGIVVSEVDPHDGRRRLVSVVQAGGRDLFRSRGRRSIEPAFRHRYPRASEAEITRVKDLLTDLSDRLANLG